MRKAPTIKHEDKSLAKEAGTVGSPLCQPQYQNVG